MQQRLQARRQLCLGLLGGLTVGSLPGVARAAQQVLPTAPASPLAPPIPDVPTTTANLAARTNADNLLTVAVRINGAGPFQFIVDTGAERTVVADTLAASLNLSPAGRINVSGLTREVSANLVTVGELGYGPFSRTDFETPVLPRSLLGADGFLGLDIIRNSRVVFDFRQHQLQIEKPTGFVPDRNPQIQTVIIRAHGNGGRLRMSDCNVDGIDTVAFVDTGAEVSVCNTALYDALHKRHPHMIDLGSATLTGVTGGEVRGTIISADTIALQSLLFRSGSIVAADVDDFVSWGLTDRPALLIGMDYLRQVASVAIDFRSKEVKFELSSRDTLSDTGRIV